MWIAIIFFAIIIYIAGRVKWISRDAKDIADRLADIRDLLKKKNDNETKKLTN